MKWFLIIVIVAQVEPWELHSTSGLTSVALLCSHKNHHFTFISLLNLSTLIFFHFTFQLIDVLAAQAARQQQKEGSFPIPINFGCLRIPNKQQHLCALKKKNKTIIRPPNEAFRFRCSQTSMGFIYVGAKRGPNLYWRVFLLSLQNGG